MRYWLVLWLVASCGRLAFDATPHRDGGGSDGGGSDSQVIAPEPRFVQNYDAGCALQPSCTILLPGATPGNVLLLTLVYGVQSVGVVSVADDSARPFTKLIDPVAWSTGTGNFRTGMWWTRNAGATAVTVTLDGQPMTTFELFVDEFVATSVDQTAFAEGVATGPTSFSSGARAVTDVPQLLFGHAEGYLATVFPAPGFAVVGHQSGNIEEAMLISAPGNYEAGFTLDNAGDWVALMVTLRSLAAQ